MALLHAAQEQHVKSLLLVQQRSQPLADRLDHDDAAAEQPGGVQIVEHPVGKGAQEVPFAELHDSLGKIGQHPMGDARAEHVAAFQPPSGEWIHSCRLPLTKCPPRSRG